MIDTIDSMVLIISFFLLFVWIAVLISSIIGKYLSNRKVKKFMDAIEIEYEKAMKEKISPDDFAKKFIKTYPQFEELFYSYIRYLKMRNIFDDTLDLLDMLREKLKKFDDNEIEFDEKLKGGKKP